MNRVIHDSIACYARSYPCEMIYPGLCAPFGEVVDYRDNAEGTISLFSALTNAEIGIFF